MIIGKSQVTPSSVAADTETTDKEALHVLDPAVSVVWSPSGTGDQQIVLNLGSSKTVRAVMVQHCNCNDIKLHIDDTASPTTLIDTIDINRDKNNRRKGRYQDSTGAIGQYVGITVNDTNTVDGETPFIGAIYAWAELQTFMNPDWGLDKRGIRGRRFREFPNNSFAVFSVGNAKTEFTGTFDADSDETPEEALWEAESNPIMFDMDLALEPAEVWPVKSIMEAISRTRENYGQDIISFTLREMS